MVCSYSVGSDAWSVVKCLCVLGLCDKWCFESLLLSSNVFLDAPFFQQVNCSLQFAVLELLLLMIEYKPSYYQHFEYLKRCRLCHLLIVSRGI